MENESFTDIIHKIKRSRRHRNHSYKSDLKPSNSDTNFVMKREKEKREISENILRTKSKNNYKNMLYNHKHTSNCKYCHSFHKLLKKDKSALSIYIENNLKYLKLFGNQRYNQNSPSLFVEDYKKKLSEKQMGLVPIPVKRNKTKSVNNYYKLYNLQRSIVMVRRYQYGRKNFGPAPTSNKTYDIALIQRWWKKIAKIILIQKNFRGYFIRKQVESVLNLHKFMYNFENLLIFLKIKNAFYRIFRSSVISLKKKSTKGYYIIKKRFFMSRKSLKKIILIQINYRILKAKNKYKRLLREQKFTIGNKFGYISKINYNINDIFEKIIIIQYNIRKYLRNKYFIEKKIINKDNGIFYIDKNYIDNYSQKIISFFKLIRHGLQIIAMKKIRSKYKKIEYYNEEDINKVIFIQKNFIKHFYNKKIKKRKNILKNKRIYVIDKIRIKDNINEINLIQKIYRQYNLNKIKFNKNLIKNKPISSTIISNKEKEKEILKPFNYNKNKNISKYFNNKLNNKKNKNINDKKYDKSERIFNNICYISKENKINVINKVVLLQRKIHSYLFLKKMKYQKSLRVINKKDFNKNFIITKANSNENFCIIRLEYIYCANILF